MEAPVFPNPTERQRMPTYVKVFNEETIAALRTSSIIDENDVKGTLKCLLIIVLSCWKCCAAKKYGGTRDIEDPSRHPFKYSGPEVDCLQNLKEVSTKPIKNTEIKEESSDKRYKFDSGANLELISGEISEFLLGICHKVPSKGNNQ